MDQFDFEKLDVYKVSFQYVVISHKICKTIPRGSGHLVDQLQRASTSILLNVCEGAGEFSKGDKAKFYRIGKRSATECSAILEILRVLQLCDELLLSEGRSLLLRIVSMLSKMSANFENK